MSSHRIGRLQVLLSYRSCALGDNRQSEKRHLPHHHLCSEVKFGQSAQAMAAVMNAKTYQDCVTEVAPMVEER